MSGLALFAQQAPELVWRNAPPRWGVFLLVVGAALFVVWVYRRESSSVPAPARACLGALRLAAILALFLVWFDPTHETKASRPKKSAVVVLIDESLSMTLADRYSPEEAEKLWRAMGHVDEQGKLVRRPPEKIPRIDVVNRLLDPQAKGRLLPELRGRNDVELYAFSSDLYPNVQPGQTRPQGRKSRLGDAIVALLDLPRDRRIEAVVLLTDGQANSDQVPPLEAAKGLADLKVPVYCVGVGSPTRPKDVALLRLRARDQVLLGDKLTISLELFHQGYSESKNVPVVLEDISGWVRTTGTGWRRQLAPGQELPLERTGRALSTQPVTLGKPGLAQPVRFVHQFDKEGVYFLRVKVPAQEGEETLANNQLVHRVEVRDDRLKVLYIEGPPRWEYRALRNWLVRDPKITTHIYLVWADPDFPQDRSQTAPDLEKWPLTREELFKYHVVILGDVDPSNLGAGPGESAEMLKHLVEFVEKKGGGLVLVAGEQWNPAALEVGPLRALLPVTSQPESPRYFTEAKRIQRTARGEGHPIFQLEDSPEENRVVWEDKYVGTFMWYKATRPVPGASVLAVHPDETYLYKPRTETRKEERRQYPIFALRNHGRGKVFFSATDETWRWRFLRGDTYFARFWAQVLRYVGTPSLFGEAAHYKLWTDRPEYEPGQRVLVTLEVLDREYNPTKDESWKLRSRNPTGKEETWFLAAVKGTPGTYSGTLYANYMGTWDLWVEKDEKRGILEEARATFEVRIPDIESRDPELNEALLKDLAARTEGAYFRPWEAARIPPLVKQASRTYAATQGLSRSAWNHAWVLAIVLGLLFVEWFVRKMYRLK